MAIKHSIPTVRKSVGFYGRSNESEELQQAITAAQEAQGNLVLLAGEAGIGKTRLAEQVLNTCGLRILRAAASLSARSPYAPICALLRDYLRNTSYTPENWGPLAPHLALLLPELGAKPAVDDPSSSDRSTLLRVQSDSG